jgi:prepilin signal peptidase PulO-like enzyme (type II secretory pathway)
LFSALLIIIFVYDLKHYIIPDLVIFPTIGLTIIYNIVSYFVFGVSYSILSTVYSALGVAGFFLVIFLVSKGECIGFGDVKFGFFMGLFLGFPNILVGLFFSFFSGAIIGLGLILSGRKKLKSQVPFGPFLITGTFIAFLLGEQIINWYLNIFI